MIRTLQSEVSRLKKELRMDAMSIAELSGFNEELQKKLKRAKKNFAVAELRAQQVESALVESASQQGAPWANQRSSVELEGRLYEAEGRLREAEGRLCAALSDIEALRSEKRAWGYSVEDLEDRLGVAMVTIDGLRVEKRAVAVAPMASERRSESERRYPDPNPIPYPQP